MSDKDKGEEKPLKPEWKIFAHEYVIDWNGTRSYMVAYPNVSSSTAASNAYKLLRNKKIQSTVESIYPKHKHSRDEKAKCRIDNRVGHVYIIHCEGSHYYKIGKSRNSSKDRMRAMQIGIPFDLTLIHNVECNDFSKVEKYMHDAYKSHRIRGEWFLFTADMVKQVITKLNSFKA